MTLRQILLAAAIALGAAAQTDAGAQAPATADPTRGEAVFSAECATCHAATQVSQDPTALSLFGVVGRKAGANADFSYSPAMQSAGVVWTRDRLNAYIENPPAVVPGNIMYYPGLSDPAQRADLIAYLVTLK